MIRKGGENHVKVFLKQLNEQQSAINFDYKIQKEQIAFLGIKLYIDQEENFKQPFIGKKTGPQTFLHEKLEYTLSLKQNILYIIE